MACRYFLIFVVTSAILLSGCLSSAESPTETKESLHVKDKVVIAGDAEKGNSETKSNNASSQPQTRDAGYQYPPPPAPLPPPAIPVSVPSFGFPGAFPFAGFPGAGFDLGGGLGASAGFDLGLGGYYPVVEKVKSKFS